MRTASPEHQHRHPAGRHRVALAGQHRPVRPRRSFRRDLADDECARATNAGSADVSRDCRTTDWSATRTISSCWFMAPETDAEALREDVARGRWRRWACACRRPRPRSATSTRASTSWASASSGGVKRGTTKRVVYTYPSKKALAAIIGRVRALTRRTAHPSLAALLRQLNPVLLGWCTYFKHGVSKATFGYLDEYAWRRVVRLDPPAIPARRSGPSCSAGSSRTGDRPRTGSCCSNRRRSRSAVTATARRTSRHHGRRPRHDQRHLLASDRGEPGAWRRARRVRRAGWGNAPFTLNGGAPQPDPTRPRTAPPRPPAGPGTGRRRRGPWR